MSDPQIFGAIIGGFLGFVVGTAIVSPKFTYLGGQWGTFEGGMGCFAGLIVRIVTTAIGAGVGAVAASAIG